ncbi:MAG: right-handed parallel beta-helix repeat-containing protein, partial [Victivallaceae bacterium]|nr:right-handed parallel beta-helix repeat-containing protein [Victivallaceae bacterium]
CSSDLIVSHDNPYNGFDMGNSWKCSVNKVTCYNNGKYGMDINDGTFDGTGDRCGGHIFEQIKLYGNNTTSSNLPEIVISAENYGTIVKDSEIGNNNQGYAGIQFIAGRCILENTKIYNFSSWGVNFNGSRNEGIVDKCIVSYSHGVIVSRPGVTIKASTIEYNYAGVYSNNANVTSLRISDNDIENSTDVGIYLKLVSNALVIGNTFNDTQGTHTQLGIYAESTTDIQLLRNIFLYGKISCYKSAGVIADYNRMSGDIRMTTINPVTGNTIRFNKFVSGSTDIGASVTVNIMGNYGYLTESSGSNVGTGTEQAIAHGLVQTPNKVNVVPTGQTQFIPNIRADATNIYIIVPTGETYNWSAAVIF